MPEYPQIVFAGTGGGAVLDIADYEQAGGFSALRNEIVWRRNPPLGRKARAGQFGRVTDTILFPNVTISPGARVNRCIIDKNVVIPTGVRIGFDREADAQRFIISDRGIVVIPKGYVFD